MSNAITEGGKVSTEHLDTEHRSLLFRAIRNVLHTEMAEDAMAQLLDGLPRYEIAQEGYSHLLDPGHPLNDHEETCPGVFPRIREFRDEFNIQRLHFNPQLLQAYQEAKIRSREFKMRLIELVSVAIHEIAVAVFNLEPKSHSKQHIDFVTDWQMESGYRQLNGGTKVWREPIFPSPPTHFFHHLHRDYDLYPNGVSDVAGYWAEDQIFGGVILFDRGDSGKECKDVFFSAGRRVSTFRICRLSARQFNDLIDFLISDQSSKKCPIPLHSSEIENTFRFDPWDAIALHHVFRDPWERRIPLEKPWVRSTRNSFDYPAVRYVFEAADAAAIGENAYNVELSRGDDDILWPVHSEPHTETPPISQASQPKQPTSSYAVDGRPEPVSWPSEALEGDHASTWIFKHGGFEGFPVGSLRLPYQGSPRYQEKLRKQDAQPLYTSSPSSTPRSPSPLDIEPRDRTGDEDRKADEQGTNLQQLDVEIGTNEAVDKGNVVPGRLGGNES